MKNILKKAEFFLIAIILVSTSIITATTATKIKSSNAILDEKVTETSSTLQNFLLDEDFSGEFPPFGWETDFWTQSDTNEAGGISPEARVYKYDQYYGGQYYDNYIMSPAIDASDYEKIILEFKFAADTYYPQYCYFYVKYRNDSTSSWVDITPWENPLSENFNGSYIVNINGAPYCGNAFQVKWEYVGYYYYYEYFYLDDVKINWGIDYVPGEAIVGFYGPLPIENDITNIIESRYPPIELKDINKNLSAALFSNVNDTNLFALQNDSDVKYAHRNYIGEIYETNPNDLGWQFQWGPPQIRAPFAWDNVTGSPTFRMAVVDTGIDTSHPDLDPNYIEGYDWVNDDEDPSDDVGHGTHVAGIIGAVGNNVTGIAGMVWNLQIIAEKVFSRSVRSGNYWNWSQGIVDAVNRGAKIISMSFGTFNENESLEQAIKFAYNHGRLPIASSGNENLSSIGYPANYSEVISVGATNQNNERCDQDDWGYDYWKNPQGSNYGRNLELMAPGDNIYSTMPTYHVLFNEWPWYKFQNYDYMSGTSMACPHVSGVAALMWIRNPDLKHEEIRCLLNCTATDLGPVGWDQEYGAGLVNAEAAVAAANFDYSISVSPENEIIYLPGSVQYTVTVSLDQGQPQTIELDLDNHYPCAPLEYKFNPSSGTPTQNQPFISYLTIKNDTTLIKELIPKSLRVIGTSAVAGCNECIFTRYSNLFSVSTDETPGDCVWIKTSPTDDGSITPNRKGTLWWSPYITSDPYPPKLGQNNKLIIKVKNLNKDKAIGPVLVKPWYIPYPRGDLPIINHPNLSTKIIPKIEKDGIEEMNWSDWFLPLTYPDHVCVYAQAWRPDLEPYDPSFDINNNNNIAQKNFNPVKPSSPYKTKFNLTNPTDKTYFIKFYMNVTKTNNPDQWALDICMPSYLEDNSVVTPVVIPPGDEVSLDFTAIMPSGEKQGFVNVWYEIEGYEKTYPELLGYTFHVINDTKPPGAPSIDGPSRGKKGEPLSFTFNAVDPDGSDVYYFIKWGDGSEEAWNGPHPSGEDFEIAHTYQIEETFTIEAKAKDIFDSESDWSEFEIEIPRNRAKYCAFLLQLFERFPNLFLILQQILGFQ